jgi:hypothetical protein
VSTTPELLTHRATAGARYAAAVTELRAAFADLAAIDRLLSNQRVAYGTLPTFGQHPDPISFRHPVYAPNVGGTFEDDVRAAYATRYAAWPTPG